MRHHIDLAAHLIFWEHSTWKRYNQLASRTSSWDELLLISVTELRQLSWQQKTIDSFLSWRNNFSLEAELAALDTLEITLIGASTEAFPVLLRDCYDPPIALFVRGELPPGPTVAIVGSRSNSAYGTVATQQLVHGLVSAGCVVVSGMARGIDAVAHQACLQHGGKTIAVLGSGIDDKSIAPRGHVRLAHEIVAAGGAVVSEFLPGVQADRYTFPKRNRIIAGLSRGIVVTEAGEKSGALITSSYGLDNQREIFALPHPITNPNGVGCNKLIQQGAHLVTTAEEILEILHLDTSTVLTAPCSHTPEETALLSLLQHEATHIDIILEQTSLATAQAMSCITALEIQGCVRKDERQFLMRRCN